jgi:hypothetical protein
MRALPPLAVTATVCLVLPGATSAQEPIVIVEQPPGYVQPVEPVMPPGAYVHDGLYLRLSLGVGGLAAVEGGRQGVAGDDLTIAGGGFVHSFALGGFLTPHLAIHADLFGASAVHPAIDVNGVTVHRIDAAAVQAVGGGLTAYTPNNVYFTGALGFAMGWAVDDFVELESDVGVAANFMIGKEWWVGPGWGVGIAGQVILFVLPSGEATFGGAAAGVLFTASRG